MKLAGPQFNCRLSARWLEEEASTWYTLKCMHVMLFFLLKKNTFPACSSPVRKVKLRDVDWSVAECEIEPAAPISRFVR